MAGSIAFASLLVLCFPLRWSNVRQASGCCSGCRRRRRWLPLRAVPAHSGGVSPLSCPVQAAVVPLDLDEEAGADGGGELTTLFASSKATQQRGTVVSTVVVAASTPSPNPPFSLVFRRGWRQRRQA